MMKNIRSKQLASLLEEHVADLMKRTTALQALDEKQLLKQPTPESWSIAQVIAHLNSYNRYYLTEIEQALQRARVQRMPYNESFSSGWFGNYFTKMMQPGADGSIARKYKSPQDHAPLANQDVKKVLTEFIEGENRLIDFLQQGAKMDMNRIRIPISISRWIKLKLGDTFRFLIAHQQRHFLQIDRILLSIRS